MTDRPIKHLRAIYDLAQNSDLDDPDWLNPSLESLRAIGDRYEIREEIATGGIKQIHRVFDRRTNREVALARLRPEAPADLIDPFIHEAWLTARLDHPGIVNIHDLAIDADGKPFFTMDLKRGQSLRALIRKLRNEDPETVAAFPIEARLEIFIKVTDAVAYAHSCNVIHLDLKPSNIQIGPFGEVLVFDWGLAKVLGMEDPLEVDRMLFHPDFFASTTPGGKLTGTPGYMAPEQIKEAPDIDFRADVFGLGCVLYHLLSLCEPFPGDSDIVLKNTLNGKVLPPHERKDGAAVPRGLSEVVMKAMARDPENRYKSALELGNEVRRYLQGFAPDAEHAGLMRQIYLLIARNKRFSLTVFIAMMALLIGTTVSFLALAERERLAVQAQRQAERNLELYQSGLMEIDALSGRVVDNLVQIVRQYQFQRMPNSARTLLTSALEQRPNDARLLNALAEQEAISHRFNSAINILESLPAELRFLELYDFARQARARKPVDAGWLRVDDFVDLLYELSEGETWAGRSSFATRLVLIDQPSRTEMHDRAQIIEALLHVLNPEWIDGWYIYDKSANSLKLGGRGLLRISNNSSVIQGLNLRELDVSHSMVRSISREAGSSIEVLRINDTPIMQRFVLERLPYLQRLYLSEKQLPILDGARLPDGAEIIVVPR